MRLLGLGFWVSTYGGCLLLCESLKVCYGALSGMLVEFRNTSFPVFPRLETSTTPKNIDFILVSGFHLD